MIINGRIVPIPTPAPAPSAPATLVQELAALIASFASTTRVGGDATPTAIQAVRLVAEWLRRGKGRWGARVGPAINLGSEADRAAAELEGQADG
jgi:hypothetical protein